jgi:hypothetical protein
MKVNLFLELRKQKRKNKPEPRIAEAVEAVPAPVVYGDLTLQEQDTGDTYKQTVKVSFVFTSFKHCTLVVKRGGR